MSLTLPIEAMSRLQVSFKVCLPDGRFSFDMAPNPTPCSPRINDLKLHFHGIHDETGGVTFTVWVSGLETNSDNRIAPENSDMSHPRHSYTPSSNYRDTLSESNPGFVPAPTIVPPAVLPLGESASIRDVCAEDIGLHSTTTPSADDPRDPISELMDIFDDDDPYMTGWPFLDGAPQYSDTTYMHMTSPLVERRPNTPPPLPTPYIPSPAPACLSFVAVADMGPDATTSVNTDNDTPSSTQSDPSPAPSPSNSSPCDPGPSSQTPSDPSRPFKCLHADCPLWFKRLYTRRVHMNTHLPGAGRDRHFPCTFAGCSMKFSRKHDRLRHEVGNHGMGTEWKCAPCNKFFSSQTTLERHYLDKHSLQGFRNPSSLPII
ncbi:hypothetical protein C8R44DRAFT_896213 [Mycena epipterygia]|nr:hypothetical protein C8R44DRAFT_896213 [Mycena epipterygia]